MRASTMTMIAAVRFVIRICRHLASCGVNLNSSATLRGLSPNRRDCGRHTKILRSSCAHLSVAASIRRPGERRAEYKTSGPSMFSAKSNPSAGHLDRISSTRTALGSSFRNVSIMQFQPVLVICICSAKIPMGGRRGAIYGNTFASRGHFLAYTQDFEARLAAAKRIRKGPGILIFCGNEFAWHRSNLEDFADFYHTGRHRADDPFALMEQHHLKENGVQLARNIDHFGFLKRHIEIPTMAEFYLPVRGPQFGRFPS
jgi:hypothetical protein